MEGVNLESLVKSVEYIEKPEDLRILFLSNAVFCPSGYGNQANGMLYEWLKKYPHTRQSTNYGIQSRQLGLNGLMIYPPLEGDMHGDRTARLIFQNWKPHIFFTLYDIWMGAYVDGDITNPATLRPIHPRWIPIIMVDHDPIPEATAICAAQAYKTITPTHYGVEQLKQNGVESHYIPFGIETKTWRPSKGPEEKASDKNWLNTRSVPFQMGTSAEINEDTFLIHLNGANKDPYRKDFMRFFIALQLFLQNNPEARRDTRVYVHSWMRLARDIPHGAKVLQVHDVCRASADYHMLCGVPDPAMARIARAADMFVHPTQGGGFEIPVLEALSCGIPVAAQDFVGLPELVEGNGWLIKPKTKYFSPLDATQSIADEFLLADAIEDAYNHPKKRESLGKKARTHALQYDWKHVNPMYLDLIEEIYEEIRYRPLSERGI